VLATYTVQQAHLIFYIVSFLFCWSHIVFAFVIGRSRVENEVGGSQAEVYSHADHVIRDHTQCCHKVSASFNSTTIYALGFVYFILCCSEFKQVLQTL
jgi:hypothetical protein